MRQPPSTAPVTLIRTRHLFWAAGLFLAITYRDAIVLSLLPFLIAVAGAALLEPIVRALHRRLGLSRGVAAFIVICVGAAAGGALALLAVAAALAQLGDLVAQLPVYRDSINRFIESWLDQTAHWFSNIPDSVMRVTEQNVQKLVDMGQSLALNAIQHVLGALLALPGLVIIMLISAIAIFFFIKDRDAIFAVAARALPRPQRSQLARVHGLIVGDVYRYLRAQLVLIGMTTAGSLLGLWLIGTPHWLVAGLVGGLLDLLPVLGPGLFYIPWAIYAIATGALGFGVSLLIVFAVISGIRYVFEAKVVGSSIGVHPLVTLFALYAGVQLFGAKGIILAPLVVIIGKALLQAGVLHWPKRD